ncbi:Uncharacterized protein FWK35_00010199 [Aphis craccivora]|uniref:Uncharacterized protein n=1 Tax=Aphis craccivora TaxID=307492 RepID=A0A6G0YJ96_APHCR|nr:Uncharacterized protein FWK35_00010199 [Aphis craccivora]
MYNCNFINPSNSERSDVCIDFTMMCFFLCVSVYSITSRNNTPISNFGGGFPIFQKNREKQKKNYEKTGIFTQNQFLTKSTFLYSCSVEKKILDDQKILKFKFFLRRNDNDLSSNDFKYSRRYLKISLCR